MRTGAFGPTSLGGATGTAVMTPPATPPITPRNVPLVFRKLTWNPAFCGYINFLGLALRAQSRDDTLGIRGNGKDSLSLPTRQRT